ncbi:3-phosphoshikimate 1-carboxyvinyltransferase [Pullulanibacillus pueri]|uniref:3-phosphoshikimate 1-carboxyvinyltransferase n=1 Tax=Pullulanibacillus pueri TaxID=1437324 RepID=A0A8J2ZUD8_9BACL|nr:3-phosphoshikimate 1-carboxyvinyltransferase [Pullulanibacillus pueri]MBM7680730.1 3-phosphoshikimate 1-carboxyvinyltransferase [Pullulanibacillus pueri]GGH78112.1 3-phosphoshikimate 1-carboxyvinyltransferase [Pullulanibacillus pueri]
MARLIVNKNEGKIQGTVRVPSSKYHLHRALIFGSLADGKSTITGQSGALHIKDSLNSLKDLGITVTKTKDGYVVEGGKYLPRNGTVRVGSSGTTSQFLLGLGSRSIGSPVTYDGHKALKARPMGPLLNALSEMGVKLESTNDRLPVTVYPGLPEGGHIKIQGTLSQWISGLIILAPFASKDTVIEAIPPLFEKTYINLTIDMMSQFGVKVIEHENGRMWTVPANQAYQPCDLSLEPDLSSAAFLLVLAALHPCDLTLEGISEAGSHPEGKVLELVQQMGVPVSVDKENDSIRIQHDGIRPTADLEIDMKDIPDLIPAMSVLAALSKGQTILKNIGPGRLKESDRVKAMVQLNKMGADIQEVGDDLIINGVESLTAASISTYNDHRVEMAFALAATRAEGASDLTFPNAYKISYPEFLDHMSQLGLDMKIEQNQKVNRKESVPAW